MVRKAGSGLATDTATAIEELFAALAADSGSVGSVERRLDAQHARGRSGLPSAIVTPWLAAVVEHLDLAVVQAVVQPSDLLGDVRLDLADGSHVWVEVKAQTTKTFAELIQADWVRDETDALRWLRHHDTGFRSLLSGQALAELEVHDPARHFGPWGLDSLFLGDVSLVSSRARRAAAGVGAPQQLGDFMSRKYLLHVSVEGARLARLDLLPCAQRIRAGGELHITIAPGGQCDAVVWVSTHGAPRRGAIEFAYYVGYRSGVLGRHKLTDYAVRSADGLFVVS